MQNQETGDPQLTKAFQTNCSINSIHFSSNNQQVAYGCNDGSIQVHFPSSKQQSFKILGESPVTALKFTQNGGHIVSGLKSGNIQYWKNKIDSSCKTIKAHNGGIKSIHFSQYDEVLLTASEDKSLKLFNDKKFKSSLIGHTNWVNQGIFSKDDRWIVSGSDDHTVRLWDVSTAQQITLFNDHDQSVNSVDFNIDLSLILSASKDIKIYDLRSKKILQQYNNPVKIQKICQHVSGNYLLSVDQNVKIWDIRQGKLLYTLFGHEQNILDCTFNQQGDSFATCGQEGFAIIWNTNHFGEIQAQKKLKNTQKYNQPKSQNISENQSLVNTSPQPAQEFKQLPIMAQTVQEPAHIQQNSPQNYSQTQQNYNQNSTIEQLSLKMLHSIENINLTLQKFDQRLSKVEQNMQDIKSNTLKK